MRINKLFTVLIILTLSAVYSCGTGATAGNKAVAEGNIKVVGDMAGFNEIINGNTPVLVDFYADWCAPCRKMAPVMEQLSKDMEGKIRVIKVDVDHSGDVARKYEIRSIPTMILFRKGKVLWQGVGMMAPEKLKEAITKNAL